MILTTPVVVPPEVVAAAFPQVHVAEAVLLRPRAGEAGLAASKVAGVPLWPSSEPWPVCERHLTSYVPVVQLRRDELPELGFPDGSDLFQLLWCPCDHETGELRPTFRWRDSTDVQGPIEAVPPFDPEAIPAEYRKETGSNDISARFDTPKACVLNPERVGELTSPWELDLDLVAQLDEFCWAELEARLPPDVFADLAAEAPDAPAFVYQDLCSTLEGWKVRGNPHWLQDPWYPSCARCDTTMQHVLTVSAGEWSSKWRMPIEERPLLAEGYPTLKVSQSPTGLSLCDAGIYVVFACPTCPDRPLRGYLQSS